MSWLIVGKSLRGADCCKQANNKTPKKIDKKLIIFDKQNRSVLF